MSRLALAGVSLMVMLSSYLLTRVLANRSRILDLPGERSSHQEAVARGGGLGIALPALTAAGAWAVLTEGTGLGALLGGTAAMLVLGYLDDRYSLSVAIRLSVEFAVVAIVLAATPAPPWLSGVLGEDLGAVAVGLTSAVALLWIVGFSNLYNFMDGIDGMAAGQAITAAACFAIVGVIDGSDAAVVLGVFWGAAALGFLPNNWPAARIFMGDAGSLFLGFSFAAFPLLLDISSWRAVAASLFALVPFVVDGGFTILRRASKRENIFRAHRSHVYQRLVQTGLSHGLISSIYTLASATVSAAAILWLLEIPGAIWLLSGIVIVWAGTLWGVTVRRERCTTAAS